MTKHCLSYGSPQHQCQKKNADQSAVVVNTNSKSK